MRAYFFGNFYLSSIQQGIQAQHCTAEMFVKYHAAHPEPKHDNLYDWARNHKTSILLNGGDDEGLAAIREVMYAESNPYPWAFFKESEGALNKTLTCVGIILPERVYEGAAMLRMMYRRRDIPSPLSTLSTGLTDWEIGLAEVMNSCGMAR